jgi:hypothetical protein
MKLARTICCTMILAIAFGANAAQDGQTPDIRSAVEDLGDGYVRLTFEARDGVCGDGWNSISFNGSHYHTSRYDDDWERDCDEGPVRVLMKVRDGEVIRIKTRVGGRWRSNRDGDLDLGVVPPQTAADFLLDIAETSRGEVAEDAILPAILARDVEVWPRLLEIARNDRIGSGVCKSAVFWLGQLAGEKITEGLVDLVEDDDEDMEVRETAVFALSQRDGRRNALQLMEIAKSNPHPRLRKQALFWLAQSDEPEALDFIEKILLGD